MSFLPDPATFDEIADTIFDDLFMTFDGWITNPVTFIYLEGSYRPKVALVSTHDPDPDLSGVL